MTETEFTLNDRAIEFTLNAEVDDTEFRITEDGELRITEEEDFRLLE